MMVLCMRGEAQSLPSDDCGTQGFFLEQLVSPLGETLGRQGMQVHRGFAKTLSEEEPIRTVQKDSGLM